MRRAIGDDYTPAVPTIDPQDTRPHVVIITETNGEGVCYFVHCVEFDVSAVAYRLDEIAPAFEKAFAIELEIAKRAKRELLPAPAHYRKLFESATKIDLKATRHEEFRLAA